MNRKQSQWLICITVAIAACGCLLAGTSTSNQGKEVPDARFAGIETGGRMTWALSTDDGYVCGLMDGRSEVGRVVTIGPSGEKKSVLELGLNSALTKEKDIWTGMPRLVARPSKGVLLLNLDCNSAFPRRATNRAEPSTGNILLFRIASGEFVNLTRLDGTTHLSTEAVAYVPEEAVIVATKIKYAKGTNDSTTVPRTSKPLYLNLKGAVVSPDKCPRAVAVYAEYVQLRPAHIKCGDKTGWRIGLGGEAFLMGTDYALPSVHFLGNGLWSIASEKIGTYLAKPADALLVKVSQREVVGCDAVGAKNLLFRQGVKNRSSLFYSASIQSLMADVGKKLAVSQPSPGR